MLDHKIQWYTVARNIPFQTKNIRNGINNTVFHILHEIVLGYFSNTQPKMILISFIEAKGGGVRLEELLVSLMQAISPRTI